MKRVLVGFNEPKLLKAIAGKIKNNGLEDLEFIVKQNKAKLINELTDGDYDVALVMQGSERDKWTFDEIMEMKDANNINLIPLISDEYRGDEILTKLSRAGVNSGVFLKGGGLRYKPDEIVKCIYNPRTPKDARQYYGVERVVDLSGESVLDDYVYENTRKELLKARPPEIGKSFLHVIAGLSPRQTGEFLRRLDSETISELKNTVEFYEVLPILKSYGVISNYRIPSEIKKKMKEAKKAQKREKARNATAEAVDVVDDSARDETLEKEKKIVNIDEDKVKELDDPVPDKDEDIDEPWNEDEDLEIDDEDEVFTFSTETVNEGGGYEDENADEQEDVDEEPDEMTFAGNQGPGDDDEEFSFASENKESVDTSDDDEFSFEGQKTSQRQVRNMEKEHDGAEKVSSGKKEKDNPHGEAGGKSKKERAKASSFKRHNLGDLDEVEDEQETNIEKGMNPAVFVLFGLAGVALLLVLVILFIRISINRMNKNEQANTSGYDTKYNPEEVARYALTDTGAPLLYDEEGNVIYDGAVEEEGSRMVPEEEMDFSVVNDLEELDGTVVSQEFNDVSGFVSGSTYKGLDLINALNGNSGANCELHMQNGAVVEIPRGSASIEDFKPSSVYKCETEGNILRFYEQ